MTQHSGLSQSCSTEKEFSFCWLKRAIYKSDTDHMKSDSGAFAGREQLGTNF